MKKSFFEFDPERQFNSRKYATKEELPTENKPYLNSLENNLDYEFNKIFESSSLGDFDIEVDTL